MFIPNGGKLREVYHLINFRNIVTLSRDKLSQLYDTIHYNMLRAFSKVGRGSKWQIQMINMGECGIFFVEIYFIENQRGLPKTIKMSYDRKR